ncbi:MAG: L-rhamnose mutarotase [Chitinophagaceae bacterium]|nr:L-rhamnose mutarotase [Chitinophagaceae bacterium]
MERIAFRMKLHEGQKETYKLRHAQLWPELKTLLKQTGIEEYSIFLDETTLYLFGFYKIADPALRVELPNHPVMKRWWNFMKDIMDTNEDHSPVSLPLEEVFYLP